MTTGLRIVLHSIIASAGVVMAGALYAADDAAVDGVVLHPKEMAATTRLVGRMLTTVGFPAASTSTAAHSFVAVVPSNCLVHGEVALTAANRLDGRVTTLTCQEAGARHDYAIDGYVYSIDSGKRGLGCNEHWCGAPMGTPVGFALTTIPVETHGGANVRIIQPDASAAKPAGAGR